MGCLRLQHRRSIPQHLGEMRPMRGTTSKKPRKNGSLGEPAYVLGCLLHSPPIASGVLVGMWHLTSTFAATTRCTQLLSIWYVHAYVYPDATHRRCLPFMLSSYIHRTKPQAAKHFDNLWRTRISTYRGLKGYGLGHRVFNRDRRSRPKLALLTLFISFTWLVKEISDFGSKYVAIVVPMGRCNEIGGLS
ncbi:hypothetical protein J3A83DRAFT_4241931, partial [Scleroderma citrinum]